MFQFFDHLHGSCLFLRLHDINSWVFENGIYYFGDIPTLVHVTVCNEYADFKFSLRRSK